ncbi:leucine-rich repeat-containing protein 57 [Cylas formicarius]|uniref:leucine-rich repeat-containing protein 57 n=1 Tax=Cylas formicarius TaxID=197179 RepID=UPI00295863EB|nr:leucine-rich repeat-containing protein 57 [Cylas formicarius]
MGNSGLKQHIETAQKTGVLKLSQGKLNEFPQGMKQLEGCLRTLDISDNKFVVLPNEISRFMQLRHLNLSKNKLAKIPDCIGALTKLETFNAGNNNLSFLPRTFSNLINLKQVILNSNHLKEFPLVFCGLKHLDILDLSQNELVAVPAEVSTLNVTELNLNQNQISVLSSEISLCPRLKILRLEENCLQLAAIHPRILSESKIANLVLDGNLFEIKQLANIEGYDAYMDRFTAIKKKMF